MRIYLLSLCMLFSLKTIAQDGYLFLKHFKVPLPDQQYVFNDLSTDKQNRLLVAHSAGILQFDGKVWDKIATESSPNQFIKIGDTTFVLTKNNLSWLKENAFKQNVVESIFENPKSLVGKDLIKHSQSYYYLIEKQIIKFDSRDFSVDTVFKSQLGYEDVFSLNDRLFAFEENYLLELVNGIWVDLNLYASKNSDFVFSCQTESRVFFAYDNGDIFIFDGENLEKYSPSLTEYLQENYPVSGKVINDYLMVATLGGGVVVVNIPDGKIAYTIQLQNGLPADEVKAITVDQQGGIWLAHKQGLSRAIPKLPLKEFQHYPGLEGLPNAILKYNDSLMVGTTEGLFFLETIKDYEELQRVLRKRIRINNPDYIQEKEKEEESFFDQLFDLNDEKTSDHEVFIASRLQYYKELYKTQGFRFRSLREKLNEKERYLKDSIQKAIVKSGNYQNNQYSYKTVKRTVNVSKLKSIKYQFTKMEGIDKKVLKLIQTPNGSFALASDGLYQIRPKKAEKKWSKLFLIGMQYDAVNDVLWLFGPEGLFSVKITNQGIQIQSVKQHLDSPITDISVWKDNIMVGNYNELKHYTFGNNILKIHGKALIDNPYSQEVLIFPKNEGFQVIKADGLYDYDLINDSLSLLQNFHQKQLSYFKDNKGKLWLSIDGDWQILNQDDVGDELKWLKILPAMDEVYVDFKQYIYFISSNKILRLNTEAEFQLKATNTFIKGAYQASSEMLEAEDIRLSYDNNSLKISLSTPEYLFPEGVKYQYFVKGLMDEWSVWSEASQIEFPFIPTGDYTLDVRARTGLYGKEKNISFEFKVMPPYWQTWWFYMLEIFFFSILILISQRLNRTKENSYLTNTMTFLTLILFIEFIATVIENNLEGYVGQSPVYGFLLNVILAVSILPLEKGMNKIFMLMKSNRHDQQKVIDDLQEQLKRK